MLFKLLCLELAWLMSAPACFCDAQCCAPKTPAESLKILNEGLARAQGKLVESLLTYAQSDRFGGPYRTEVVDLMIVESAYIRGIQLMDMRAEKDKADLKAKCAELS